ncbi:hypothetical protein B0A55_01542 [Friedmanniomyces simplex]|uniref:BRCT domain-containing protein n=1 Tax=Friedmanniomyces simplex TaxID=329884 RepID=A0A4U0Y448_9PEZI|nr:hypothetical protein B0A55_01542 [Friedmanniomyces simplex]
MAESDLSNTLWKKPVRRATAKKAETEAKPKTTRSKSAAPTTDDIAANTDERPLPALQAKPTRRGPGRPRKEAPESAAEETAEPPARATRCTKASTSKSKKVQVGADAEPNVSTTTQPKTTRRTRATATTAKPLSPKKITQVSKTRDTRDDAQKRTAAKGAMSKETVKCRAKTRKRTVSDENAEVPVFPSAEREESGNAVLPSAPAKTTSPQKTPAKMPPTASEASMSSRATTPSDSPAPPFDYTNDANEYYRSREDDVASVSDSVEKLADPNEHSEDELCGPKTPMKRTMSPGAEARYKTSVQKSIHRRTESPQRQTTIRPNQTTRRPLATPRTQLPYRKPAVPQSNSRAITLAHGGDRGLVFTQGSTHDAALEQTSPLPAVSVEASLLDFDGSERAETPDDSGEEPSEAEIIDGNLIDNDLYSSTVDAHSSPAHATHTQHDDPEETIVIHDREDEASTPFNAIPAESFDTDDTVLINHDHDEDFADMEADVEETQATICSPHSPTPETIIWDNIRQDITIPLHFDAHYAVPANPPPADFGAVIGPDDGAWSPMSDGGDDSGAEDKEQQDPTEAQPHSQNDATELVDGTINFNDFIDLGSLSEPTQSFEVPAQPARTVEQVADATSAAPIVPEDNAEPAEVDAVISEHIDKPTAEEGPVDEPEQAPQHHAIEDGESAPPHYALPTVSFDARRKSLPAITYHTPIKAGARPNTSDGASAPRFRLTTNWRASQSHHSDVAPHAAAMDLDDATIATPRAQLASSAVTPVATPKERYPRMTSRPHYEDHAKTAAPPSRFRTPVQQPARKPATTKKVTNDIVTPRASTLRPRAMPMSAASATPHPVTPQTPGLDATPSTATPLATPSERFPRIPPRANSAGHAKTVAAPRFQTPARTPAKHPSTVQKHGSLRKVAFKNSTPLASHTPIKTPLKPPAMTPSQAPMTPHPAAPLRGVVAMVEVYTLEGASASTPFIALLRRLGAKTTKVWGETVTHVIFKDGSPTTLQRVRLHNKEVEETGKGVRVHCVNSRWVSDCDAEGKRMDEDDEVYVVDVAEVPRAGKRRRKSMEPSTLVNLRGNIVRVRKSSLGRSSLGRSPLKFVDSPEEKKEEDEITTCVEVTPSVDLSDKENAEDAASSPATPAYLAAPEKLVQQTAPINRMRKLGGKTRDAAKLRRLTFFNGSA